MTEAVVAPGNSVIPFLDAQRAADGGERQQEWEKTDEWINRKDIES